MADVPALASRSHEALADQSSRAAVRMATGIMVDGRARALGGLDQPEELRDAARALRTTTVARLPDVLETWSANLEARGGKVCWAADAEEAVAYVLDVVRARGAKLIAKSKSMASEEIHLNHALEAEGIEVVETDLGEFIIQLAGETPSHLIIPAIHKNRGDVAALFSADAGRPVSDDIQEEARYARARLREVFLKADIGISGVNFAVADTGSICLVTNEGNGRMVTSLPPVHIAIMGMERIVQDWSELDVMLSLLARSATGQQLTVYTNVVTGPRAEGELDGPEELHVIVLDNGRHRVLASEFREALNCIRCGACLNVCPVYRHVGGHSYGSVYSGPIGAVLTPLLHPEDPKARELSQASSLCSACVEACPVRIPLADMLLGLRRRDVADLASSKRAGFRLWSLAWSTRAGFVLTGFLLRPALAIGRWLRNGPGWAGAWLRYRTAPRRR
ncbi:MAG: LutB/LldF family L-lactate oxidation iron-sulfur protein [Candidatus Dormibacteria bacterium]